MCRKRKGNRYLSALICTGIMILHLMGLRCFSEEPAAVPLSEKNTSELKVMADAAIGENNPELALPILDELISRLKGSTNSQILESLEPLFYFRGMAALQLGAKRIDIAEDSFREYLKRFPENERVKDVLIRLGDCLERQGKYMDAVDSYQKVLKSGKIRINSELQDLKEKITEAYMDAHNWEGAMPFLKEMLKESKDPTIISQSAVALIQCFIETGHPEKTIEYLPMVESRNASARHSIEFNISLMNGGDKAFAQGQYSNALYLYQIAKTKEELMEWHVKELTRLEAQRKEALKNGNIDLVLVCNSKIDRNKLKTEILKGVNEYTQELMLRTARCYFELGRKYEAMWGFFALYKDFKNSTYGEQALFATFGLAAELGFNERAEDLGKTFMQLYPKSESYGQLALMRQQIFLQNKNFTECLSLFTSVFELKKDDPNADYLDQMLYLAGYSRFQNDEIEEARKTFLDLRKRFPKSSLIDAVNYWIGMTYLFSKEYGEARSEFAELVARFPDSEFAEDASFRICVCHYASLDFKAAKTAFDGLIQKYPQGKSRSESHMFLGDIAAADGAVDEAVKQYREVPKWGDNMVQINYAVFQIGKLYDQLGDFAKMDDLFSIYLKEYGVKGNYTEAVYRIGYAKRNKGDTEGGLKIYFDTVVEYANDPAALGVDYILADWPNEYKTVKGKFPLEIALEEVKKAVSKKERTAELRWRMALAKMGQAPETGFAIQEEDFQIASAGSLVWIAEISNGNTDQKQRANLMVLKRFGTSEFILQPLKALALEEIKNKNYSKAIEYLKVIEEKFATSEDAGWATVREADCLLANAHPKEAIALYEKILENKDWRGPIWPEAIYQLGTAYYKQNDIKKSFAYFQRVYVLYLGYPEWAAKAYWMSGQCLEKLQEKEQAISTYREMIQNKELASYPEYADSKKRMESLQ